MGSEFPIFLSCSAQFGKGIVLTPSCFFPALLCCSPFDCFSKHIACANQTNVLAFPYTQMRLVCSARPHCALANLSDVMKAGVSNASRSGKMWHLHAIDKLQLPSYSGTKFDELWFNTKSSILITTYANILRQISSACYLRRRFAQSIYVTAILTKVTAFSPKCHRNLCGLLYQTKATINKAKQMPGFNILLAQAIHLFSGQHSPCLFNP